MIFSAGWDGLKPICKRVPQTFSLKLNNEQHSTSNTAASTISKTVVRGFMKSSA